MDPTTQQQIVEQITPQITESLQLQQKEQMKKMQEELDKMKELLGKKNHKSDSEGRNEDASKVSKTYNKTGFDYCSSSKNPILSMINPRKPPPFDGIRYTDWAHRMKLHLIAVRC